MGVIGKTVTSKGTGARGQITEIKGNKVFVNFESGGSIPVQIDKIDSLLIMDQETRDLLTEEINKQRSVANSYRKKSPGANTEGTENIAFKITYCDGGETEENYGFRGPCSKECRLFNQKHGRAWCSNDENLCCQLSNYTITKEEFDRGSKDMLCYESKMLIDWKAYAGYDNAKNPPRPRRFVKLCHTGIALLTTVPKGEDDRYIFGLFKIAKHFEGNETQEGYVEADPRYRIEFTKEESRQMRFWDFYSNKQSEKERWGTGLFRYLSNEQVLAVLKKALQVKEGKEDYNAVKELLDMFCKEKSINTEN